MRAFISFIPPTFPSIHTPIEQDFALAAVLQENYSLVER
jgi:hypothetical protein